MSSALSHEARWLIWMYRCPGGESADDMVRRVDTIIAKVKPGRSIAHPS
jgi:hypothetical protein